MKALILVGGFGTRLRPLTFTMPKPLVDFANRPMIMHQIEALAKVGVKEIVLAVNYQPHVMVEAMKRVEEDFNIKVTFSLETEPLGTGGPIALAKEVLGKDDSPFFVLNSDVICPFPFEKLLKFHLDHGCEGTILVTKVEDPSKYGVVVTSSGSTQVERFVEKPQQWVGNLINAGIYVLNPKALRRFESRPMSIEKEVFPFMAADGQLHIMDLGGFWADVGQPKDFLAGTAQYLKYLSETPEVEATAHSRLAVAEKFKSKNIELIGNAIIDSTATIGKDCKIGPNVVVGARVKVGDGVRLSDCVLMPDSLVKDNALVQGSIVGWHSTVGRWARLFSTAVLGEDVHIADEVLVNGGSILPHKSVSVNIMEPKIVM